MKRLAGHPSADLAAHSPPFPQPRHQGYIDLIPTIKKFSRSPEASLPPPLYLCTQHSTLRRPSVSSVVFRLGRGKLEISNCLASRTFEMLQRRLKGSYLAKLLSARRSIGN